MADNTDTARPGEREAVKAAEDALEDLTQDWDLASFAVAAAYPVIAAAVREQVAQEQEREATDPPPESPDYIEGWHDATVNAARIARGSR